MSNAQFNKGREVSKPTYRKGFTLIELLVVISIISMLSSVVFSSVNSARKKATVAAGQILSGQMKRGMGDDMQLFLDFDGISALTLANVQANQKGLLSFYNVSSGSSGTLTPVNDTSLYKVGNNLNVPSGGNAAGLLSYGIKSVFSSGASWTIAAWYNPASGDVGSASAPITGWPDNARGAGLLVNPDSATGNVTTVSIRVPNASGDPIYGGYTNQKDFSINLPAGQWVFLAASARNDGSNNFRIRLYVNGSQYGSTWLQTVTPMDTIPGWASNNILGVELNAMPLGGFCCGWRTTGLLDDVSIYSRSLVASEIHNLYAQELAKHQLATNQNGPTLTLGDRRPTGTVE
jgi:prepilin-type N-terminal cleavage/methylation domain-containing protein